MAKEILKEKTSGRDYSWRRNILLGYNDQRKIIFAAGNFYGVIPYEGRYDALLPTVFHLKPAIKDSKAAILLI